MAFKDYPKTVKLRDGGKIVLRPVTVEDEEALFAFFKGSAPRTDSTSGMMLRTAMLFVDGWSPWILTGFCP